MDVDYIDHWSIWRDIGILFNIKCGLLFVGMMGHSR